MARARKTTKMVSPFVKRLDNLQPSEPLVDCQACQVKSPLVRPQWPRPYKCCSFQPFWSLFQAGAYVRESGRGLKSPLLSLPEGTVFLPVGIVPPAPARQRQEEAPLEARYEDPGSVCPHYGLESGDCGIFNHRPLECRRYFCASQFQKTHDQAFVWASSRERKGMDEYLLSVCAYGEGDWATWAEYLDSDGWKRPLPGTALAEQEAWKLYREASIWWDGFLAREKTALEVRGN